MFHSFTRSVGMRMFFARYARHQPSLSGPNGTASIFKFFGFETLDEPVFRHGKRHDLADRDQPHRD
jgi:hypothetical protein